MPLVFRNSEYIRYLDTYWEDLRFPALSVSALGSNPPSTVTFKTSDSVSVGNSIAQDANGQTCQTTIDGADLGFGNSMNLSISFWLQSGNFAGTQRILEIGSFYIEWRFSDNLRIGGYGGNTLGGPVINGQRTHVVFTLVNTSGTSYVATLYLNGTKIDDDSFTNGSMPAYATDVITLFGDNFRGKLDALAFFDAVLDQSDVTSYYSSGDGLAITGSETDLLYGWNFDEGTGTTAAEVNGGATGQFSGVDAWDDGLVTSNSTQGVIARSFSPDINQELYFDVQLPHAWAQGTEIRPHVHWSPSENGSAGQDVSWALEYTWSNIGSVFGDTQIVYGDENYLAETLVKDKHYITNLEPIVAPDRTFSSMLKCRLFRDATSSHGTDNYTGYANLHEFDIHVQVNAPGSEEEYTKD